MLKFLLACMLMTMVNSWRTVRSSLFILSFILMMDCHHGFSNYMTGWCYNIDSSGYILISLSFWITALVICSWQKVMEEDKSLYLWVNIFLWSLF